MTDDLAGAKYVMVGFGSSLMASLEEILPARSLAVIEEADVAEVRNVAGRCRVLSCFAGLVPAAIQDEDHVDRVLGSLPRFGAAAVVFPGVEYGVVAAAGLAERLGLPGASLGAARVLRDKARLREAAARAGLSQPRWFEVGSASEADRARRELGGTCVLKPANRQGSLGVQLLSPRDDMGRAWRHAVSADEPRLRTRRKLPSSFLVEERMTGPEVSVECLVANSLVMFRNVTAKSVFPGPFPVESGHVVPAPITAEAAGQLDKCMDLLIAATGFATGILHAEWILGKDGVPGLVECAGRIPGDGIPALIDLVYGGSLVAGLLAVLGGTELPEPREPRRAAAIRFLATPAGTVRAVDGAEAARRLPGVTEVSVSARPGQERIPLTSSTARAGHVLAVADDPETAASRAAAAAAAVRISMDA